MARSARRPEPAPEPHPAMAAAAAVGAAVARRPALAGGSTAFLVALAFVSANALWYQPFPHPDALFPTREMARGEAGPLVHETTILIERPQPAEGDPTTKAAQTVLKDLGLYQGTIDGLPGPATRDAVAAYQKAAGLPVTGMIDAALLEQLDTGATAAITPQPRPTQPAAAGEPIPARFEGEDSTAVDRIRKIQAGLREFGRKDVTIDGVVGTRTRAAIREFQALFGLKETGEPDEAVYAKMRQEHLID